MKFIATLILVFLLPCIVLSPLQYEVSYASEVGRLQSNNPPVGPQTIMVAQGIFLFSEDPLLRHLQNADTVLIQIGNAVISGDFDSAYAQCERTQDQLTNLMLQIPSYETTLAINAMQEELREFKSLIDGLRYDDSDRDGIKDGYDNCIIANPDQKNQDGDVYGDACDLCPTERGSMKVFTALSTGGCPDQDDDGIGDDEDNCVAVYNPEQTDLNTDGQGDICQDSDGDGVMDGEDNCVEVANTDQQDTNRDKIGDACQDSDEDGILDNVDNCLSVHNPDQLDSDDNGTGDICQDSDEDGIVDPLDNCPDIANEDQADANSDEIGDVCAVAACTINLETEIRRDERLYRPIWSPDGSKLLVHTIMPRDAETDVINLLVYDTGQWEQGRLIPIEVEFGGGGYFRSLVQTLDESPIQWSPDSTKVAISDNRNHEIEVWDIATAEQTHQIDLHGHLLNQFAWNPDGTRLAFSIAASRTSMDGYPKDTQVIVWNMTTNEKEFTLSQDDETDFNQLAWSPDGAYLATAGSWSGLIWVWDTTTREEFTRLEYTGKELFDIAWSTDGKNLAYAVDIDDSRLLDNAKGTIHLWSPETGQTRRVFDQKLVRGMRFNSDGSLLAVAAYDSAPIIDVETGETIVTLNYRGYGTMAFEWLAGNEILAMSRVVGDGEMFLYDTANWTEIESSDSYVIPRARWFAFSPDGTRIVTTWATYGMNMGAIQCH